MMCYPPPEEGPALLGPTAEPATRERLIAYRERLSKVELSITGSDLVALGYRPGRL